MFYRIFRFAKCFLPCKRKMHDRKIIFCGPLRKQKHCFFSLLQHVRNSLNGEAKVLTPAQAYNVDGFHAPSNTVFEYYGCIFHGCRKCYPKQGNLKHFCHPDRTVDEVYEATLKKAAILRHAGYNVVEMWGCDWTKQKESDLEVIEFLKTFEYVPPLDPRDAFFGGERVPRRSTQKQPKMKRSAIWITLRFIRVLTSMAHIPWGSGESFISPKTRILKTTSASCK